MEFTAKEIAEWVGGQIDGDASVCMIGPASIDTAGPFEVAYLSDLGKTELIKNTRAGCMILPESARGKKLGFSGTKIYVSNPQWAFVQVLRRVQESIKKPADSGIHPNAVVDCLAKIGKEAYIGPHCVIERNAAIGDSSVISAQCYIGKNVKIGKNCKFYPNVTVREDCVIGDRVILHPGVVIGADGFGYVQVEGKHEKIPQMGKVVIEDDVEIGACSTIDRAALGETRIGAGTKIDNLVQVAHNVQIGRACIIVAQAGIAGSAKVGDGAVIAGQAGIGDHVNVGSRAVVTGQTGVISDIPDGQVVFGTPARPHREAFKLLAVYGKLLEIYKTVKRMEKQFADDK